MKADPTPLLLLTTLGLVSSLAAALPVAGPSASAAAAPMMSLGGLGSMAKAVGRLGKGKSETGSTSRVGSQSRETRRRGDGASKEGMIGKHGATTGSKLGASLNQSIYRDRHEKLNGPSKLNTPSKPHEGCELMGGKFWSCPAS